MTTTTTLSTPSRDAATRHHGGDDDDDDDETTTATRRGVACATTTTTTTAAAAHYSIFYPHGLSCVSPVLLHYLVLRWWRTVAGGRDYYTQRRLRPDEVRGHTVYWLHNALPRDRFVFLVYPVERAATLRKQTTTTTTTATATTSTAHESWWRRLRAGHERRRDDNDSSRHNMPAFAVRRVAVSATTTTRAQRGGVWRTTTRPRAAERRVREQAPAAMREAMAMLRSPVYCPLQRSSPSLDPLPASPSQASRCPRHDGSSARTSLHNNDDESDADDDTIDDCCVYVDPARTRAASSRLSMAAAASMPCRCAACTVVCVSPPSVSLHVRQRRQQHGGNRDGDAFLQPAHVTPTTRRRRQARPPSRPRRCCRDNNNNNNDDDNDDDDNNNEETEVARVCGVEVVEVWHGDVTALDYRPGLVSSRLSIEAACVRTYYAASVRDALVHYGCCAHLLPNGDNDDDDDNDDEGEYNKDDKDDDDASTALTLVSQHVDTVVSVYTADPSFAAVLRELLLPSPPLSPSSCSRPRHERVATSRAYTTCAAATAAAQQQQQRRLLALYEAGMPSWSVLLARTRLPYRARLRRAVVLVAHVLPLISLGAGCYDLYRHLPQLTRFVARVVDPLTRWLDQHVLLRVSMLATYVASVAVSVCASVANVVALPSFVAAVGAWLTLLRVVCDALLRAPLRVAYDTAASLLWLLASAAQLAAHVVHALVTGPLYVLARVVAASLRAVCGDAYGLAHTAATTALAVVQRARDGGGRHAAAAAAALTSTPTSAALSFVTGDGEHVAGGGGGGGATALVAAGREFWTTVASPLKHACTAAVESLARLIDTVARREVSMRQRCQACAAALAAAVALSRDVARTNASLALALLLPPLPCALRTRVLLCALLHACLVMLLLSLPLLSSRRRATSASARPHDVVT